MISIPRARRFLPLILLIVLALVFFYRLAFTDLILARGDTFTYFYPYWTARNAAFMEGRLPLWTPDLFMGAPLLANPQIGTFYPPNWIVAPLSAPDGVRVSILMHAAWAGIGAYVLARRAAKLSVIAALLASVIYAFGGHVTAHAEQVNQYQGLSWLPFILFCVHTIFRGNPAVRPHEQANHAKRVSLVAPTITWVFALSATIALQFFSGHTQTVFITATAAAILTLITLIQQRRIAVRSILALIAAAVIALVLALPQLIPTLELSQLSSRGGGMTANEATAFSFSPFIAGRGLLPNYESAGVSEYLSTEYIAHIGVIGLALAWIGMFTPIKHRWLWIVLAGVGLFFAFGLYNPVYTLIAGLPGFNLFRVPARWLALFALGAAMLAGMGLDHVRTGGSIPRAAWIIFFAGLIALVTSTLLADRQPDGTPTSTPTLITAIGWGIAAFIVLVIAILIDRKASAKSIDSSVTTGESNSPSLNSGRGLGGEVSFIGMRVKNGRNRLPPYILFTIAAVLELFLASHTLPHNDLTAPEAWSAERFTISQLQAYQEGQEPTGRVLSISNTVFDPGDVAALTARYQSMGLSPAAIRNALVAIKLKEVVAGNLGLAWGIPSIDGYDGGILPTRWYSAFTSLMLPEGAPPTTDGRLRELLAREECFGACVPDARWLNLAGVQYVITDKVYHLWHDGVAFDTTPLPVHSPPYEGQYVAPENADRLQANAVDVLFMGDPEQAPVISRGEAEILEPPIEIARVANQPVWRVRYTWLDPNVNAVFFENAENVAAVTLVDTRTGAFLQLLPYGWQRVLSSDINVYESPSAGGVGLYMDTENVITVPDNEQGTQTALDMLRNPTIPLNTLIFATDAPYPPDVGEVDPLLVNNISITVVEDQADYMRFMIASPGNLLLFFPDAYYPGWIATIDGQPMPVYRAQVMFRALYIPRGYSDVILQYRPAWLIPTLVIGGAGWLMVALGIAFGAVRQKTTGQG